MNESKAGNGVYNSPNRPSVKDSKGEDGTPESMGDSPPQEAHQLPQSGIWVEEASGVAAAEATGKIGVDTEEDPDQTAGSG